MPVPPPKKPRSVEYRGFTFPTAIGECADLLYSLRAARTEAQKATDQIDARFKALQEYVIETLPKSNASGIAGKLARVQSTVSEVPQVQDWALLHRHIQETGAFELMQRRLSDSAIKERWESGASVPGVGSFQAVKLSITKL